MCDNDPEAIVINAYITAINCPHCTYPTSNYVNDPRGGEFNCEGCHQSFKVPEDAKIDFG